MNAVMSLAVSRRSVLVPVLVPLLVLAAAGGGWWMLGGPSGIARRWNGAFSTPDPTAVASQQAHEAREAQLRALEQLLSEVRAPIAKIDAGLRDRRGKLALLQEYDRRASTVEALRLEPPALERLRASTTEATQALERMQAWRMLVQELVQRAEQHRADLQNAGRAEEAATTLPLDADTLPIKEVHDKLFRGLHAIHEDLVRPSTPSAPANTGCNQIDD